VTAYENTQAIADNFIYFFYARTRALLFRSSTAPSERTRKTAALAGAVASELASVWVLAS
jgi:hypothetical protein